MLIERIMAGRVIVTGSMELINHHKQEYAFKSDKYITSQSLTIIMAQERYVFVVQWFDAAASIVRTYNLTYFLKDNTLEMYDIKNRRIFLKRCEYPSIQTKDLFIGATVNFYARQLKVIDYADQFTRNRFEKQKGKTFAMIKPDSYLNIGRIINCVEEAGFTIGNLKMAKMSRQEAELFYSEHKGKPFFDALVDHMSSDLVVGLQLIADDCVNKWRQFLGPTNSSTAKQQAPKSIRGLFGVDGTKNAAHGSDSQKSAARELEFFFSNKSTLRPSAYFNNCSCLVIKPHIITEGYIGQIVDFVLSSGFEISAMQMFWLDRPSAEEFSEVYRGIVPEYNQIIEQLTNGPCIAMEVRQNDPVTTLREICGPHDPDMARTVRPKTIRAIYGKDKAKNAVHCTDLIQDGMVEVQYFFNILQK